MLYEATQRDTALLGRYNSMASIKAETGAGSINGSESLVCRRINSDVCHLLYEQHEFLLRARPEEIRTLLFLRLRRSAQLKRTAQCNQAAERRAQRSRHCSTSLTVAGQGSDAANINIIEEVTPIHQITCQGCLRRYTDMAAFGHHQKNCKKYAAFIKGSDDGAVMMSKGANTARYIDGAGGASQSMDATTTRRFLDCRGKEDNASTNAVMSLHTESQSINCSPSLQVSPPQEERLGKNDNEGSFLYHTMSRDCSPAPFSPQLQQHVSSACAYSIDDVPASVEARQLRDKESSFQLLPSGIFSLRAGEDSESLTGANQPPFSPLNMAFEGGAVDEPLKPCPHCGRRFFAESRWPRHVAVCEQQKQQAKQVRTSVLRNNLDSSMKRTSSFTPNTNTKSFSTLGNIAQNLTPENSLRRSGAMNEKNDVKRSRQSVQTSSSLMQRTSCSQSRASVSSNMRRSTQESHRVYCSICGRSFTSAAAEQHMIACKKRLSACKQGNFGVHK